MKSIDKCEIVEGKGKTVTPPRLVLISVNEISFSVTLPIGTKAERRRV